MPKKCKCESTYLSSWDFYQIEHYFVKPEELAWRCTVCDKARALSKKEQEVARMMFRNGHFFGKKENREKVRKVMEEL